VRKGEILIQSIMNDKVGAGIKAVKVSGAISGLAGSATSGDKEQMMECVDLAGRYIQVC